jgi:hypothetical protein
MDPAYALLYRFAQMGWRHSLQLKSGTQLEGCIIEVEPERLIFCPGGPLAPSGDLQVPLVEVNLDSLTYHDPQKRTWVAFKPNPGCPPKNVRTT